MIKDALDKAKDLAKDLIKDSLDINPELKTSSNLPEDEIIYLTGMSINKKTFHNVYRLMSNDEDFKEVFRTISKSVKNTKIKDIKKGLSSIETQIPAGMPLIKALRNGLIVSATASATVIPPLAIVSIVGIGFDAFEAHRNQKSKKNWKNINYGVFAMDLAEKIVNQKDTLIERLNDMSFIDFFSIFQSNQSDIRGLNSLTSENSFHERFVLHYSYADKPFYENLFINALELNFTRKFFTKVSLPTETEADTIVIHSKEELIKLIYDNSYKEHIHDIVLGKLLKDDIINVIDDNKNNSSLFDKLTEDSLKVLKDGFNDRNLFGIDLLSRFLLSLINNIEPVDKLKVYVDSSFIDSQDINRITAFSEEIWEYGSSPEHFEFTQEKDEADIILKTQYLDNDKFNPPNETNSTEDLNSRAIRIPVKIFISLPIELDENNNQIPTREIAIPERSVHNAKDNGTMNIYTVGGIEHNRPLMRLVNIHRQQKSDKRILGFFDNHFDYHHKIDKRGEDNFFHYFLMGANQLVSGLNSSRFARFDDKTGNSIGTDAKIIYFNIEDKDSKFTKDGTNLTFHIVSIYGFSAIASAYATLWSIINIKEALLHIDCSKGYSNSLAFKALNITDKNQIPNELNVYTKRVKFQDMPIMEAKLKQICHGLEPFTYVRLEYLQPEEDRNLIKFMYGIDDNGHLIRAEAVVKVEDGSSQSKQDRGEKI